MSFFTNYNCVLVLKLHTLCDLIWEKGQLPITYIFKAIKHSLFSSISAYFFNTIFNAQKKKEKTGTSSASKPRKLYGRFSLAVRVSSRFSASKTGGLKRSNHGARAPARRISDVNKSFVKRGGSIQWHWECCEGESYGWIIGAAEDCSARYTVLLIK